jgi:hypothetical protein
MTLGVDFCDLKKSSQKKEKKMVIFGSKYTNIFYGKINVCMRNIVFQENRKMFPKKIVQIGR